MVKVFLVGEEQLDRCKIRSLRASHYNDNGSCACHTEEEKKMEFPTHPNDYPASLTRSDLEVRMRGALEVLEELETIDGTEENVRRAWSIVQRAKKLLQPYG